MKVTQPTLSMRSEYKLAVLEDLGLRRVPSSFVVVVDPRVGWPERWIEEGRREARERRRRAA